MSSSNASLPNIPVSLVRAAAPWKRSANATTVLPEARKQVEGWLPAPDKLADYRKVVGSSAQVPLAFPQVAVMAMHLDLISGLSFPVKAMGLIHLASDVQVLGELPVEGPWQVRAWVGPGRHVRAGFEFDLCGEVSVDGEPVWSSRAITLSRSKSASGAEQSSAPEVDAPEPGEDWAEPVTVPVPEGTGRSFGRVTGDVNPIHLHSLTAKAFGFKAAIAHGWWTTARIAALLNADEAVPGRRLRVVFKRPVFLPSMPGLLARPVATLPAVGEQDGTEPGQRYALVADSSADSTSTDEPLKVLVYGDVTHGRAAVA